MYKILGVGHLPPNPGWRMKAHSHKDNNELIIPIDGKLHLRSDELTAIAGPGNILIYPAGRTHEEMSDIEEPVNLLFMSFYGSAGSQIRVIKDSEHQVRRLGQYLIKARQRGAEPELVTKYAEVILEECFALEAEGTEQLVSETRSFMRRNLKEPLTVQDMADNAHMSKYHFIRTYRKLTGTTPQADFRRLRIEEAAHLLETTALPIKAVAPMAGFTNEYHFSRVFKKVIGIPPGKYRNQHL